MKKFFGLVILLILLVAASGCTQPAKTTTAPPAPTEVVATAAPTPEPTMPATAAATPATTAAATPEPTAEVTRAATPEETPKPVLTHSKTTVIYIRNNTFVPQEMMVLPGTGITWINEDKTVHSVKTLPDIGIKFVSGEIVPGATFGYTFSEKEGTYGFIDPTTNATGMIIVKKGESVLGAPKTQTPTPTATP